MQIDSSETKCFCFDRDRTVDTGLPEGPVPVEFVQMLAEETDHEVWATGNQALTNEAGIPGKEEAVSRLPNHIAAAVRSPGRTELSEIVRDVTDADEYIVVDDVDLSDMDHFDHYYPWDFVEEVDIDGE